jgi:lipopolysaccharide/colanic/teichoic acid biosynthesis glycosyltransferase
MSALTRAQLAVKLAVDVLVSAVLLVILLPAMIVIAVAVKATSPGEIVYRQKRAGRDGRDFTIYKFRTMTQEASRSGLASRVYRGDPRITRVGRFLRATSLDELPQLLNVLRGEMSIVGPRPDVPQHVENYTAFQRQRLEVRPGITGWAQVRKGASLPREQGDVPWTEGEDID